MKNNIDKRMKTVKRSLDCRRLTYNNHRSLMIDVTNAAKCFFLYFFNFLFKLRQSNRCKCNHRFSFLHSFVFRTIIRSIDLRLLRSYYVRAHAEEFLELKKFGQWIEKTTFAAYCSTHASQDGWFDKIFIDRSISILTKFVSKWENATSETLCVCVVHL